jgi:hypothetical protein
MLHRIRLGMKNPRYGDSKLGGEGGGPVEIDETLVGGKLINMHKSKKVRYEQLNLRLRFNRLKAKDLSHSTEADWRNQGVAVEKVASSAETAEIG